MWNDCRVRGFATPSKLLVSSCLPKLPVDLNVSGHAALRLRTLWLQFSYINNIHLTLAKYLPSNYDSIQLSVPRLGRSLGKEIFDLYRYVAMILVEIGKM